MSLIWPIMLIALAVVPLLAGLYFQLLERRAASLAQMGTMRLQGAGAAAGLAAGPRIGRRRHVPPAIFLGAITLLVFSLSRPAVAFGLPHREGTVILAFDVSSSMKADDLKPTRMDAAKDAAATFVDQQPSTIRIGIVAFSDTGLIVQQPTNVKADVLAAIKRLSPQGATSVGDGIFTSLKAISDKPIVLDDAAIQGDLTGVDIGYFGWATVVLLSDGENTSRSDPLVMAQLAANAGVRVSPIGIGSTDGTVVELDGYSVATALDEPLLQKIADTTGGTYYHAADQAELKKVYGSIDLHLAAHGEETEVTSLIAAAALVLLMVGGGLSMRWFGRVP